MQNVFDVVDWFCIRQPMNHEKLECLLYLSYAWYLAKENKELFETDGFEALPVLACEMQVFNMYHLYGKKHIQAKYKVIFNEEIEVLLESILEVYGQYDGVYLSQYIRQTKPYLNARKYQTKIVREDMKEEYGNND